MLRLAGVWGAILLASVAASAQPPAGPVLQDNARVDAGTTAVAERLNRVRGDLFSGTPHFAQDVEELKAILAREPGAAEPHLLLGMAYRGLGSPDLVGETIAEFRQALTINPGLVPPRFYLAQMYLELARAARAREELEAGLVQVPGNPQFLALLGEAERQLKNPSRAVELTRQALQADPAFTQARYYLGLALFDRGLRDEAIKELEQVVRSGAQVADPYLNLGSMYLEAGRADDALEILTQGTRIDPARADLRVQLARAHRVKGSLVKADEQLTIAFARAGAIPAGATSSQQQLEFDIYLEQGLLRLAQGRLDAAEKALQRVLTLDPAHGPSVRYLAEVYMRRGLYKKALEYATRAETLGFPLPADQRKALQAKLRASGIGGRQ
ncbi:MAG: tetratricopeptide repeat protein [Acidobacteriota bacterium]